MSFFLTWWTENNVKHQQKLARWQLHEPASHWFTFLSCLHYEIWVFPYIKCCSIKRHKNQVDVKAGESRELSWISKVCSEIKKIIVDSLSAHWLLYLCWNQEVQQYSHSAIQVEEPPEKWEYFFVVSHAKWANTVSEVVWSLGKYIFVESEKNGSVNKMHVFLRKSKFPSRCSP